ncbi:MAG: MEDS domain-containing protein [Candidatus Bathyarchaeota archaeon]|nr:MAG: MEDS domain-containing protein [Candidatus Bathyarchaeota archaeon]
MLSFIKEFLRRMEMQPSFRVEAGSVLSMREGEVAVATYMSTADKMKIFSAYIREGLEKGDRVDYTYPEENGEIVRAKLEEHEIDVEKYERTGALIMNNLTEYYMPDGNFDLDRVVKEGLDLRAEAKRKGYKRARELIDVGDFSFIDGQWQKYLEYWNDPRWGAPPGVGILYGPFITELTVFNVESMNEAQVGDILKAFGGGTYPHTKSIDLLENEEAFSKRINITHEKLLGCKFLLEFDPTFNYERVVEDFAKEAMANVEPIFVFTSKTSSIHSCLAEELGIKFFLSSVSTSIPKSTSKNTVILPANNMPLILDALSKALETYGDANVCFVFGILSELLTSVGQERTYLFLHHALDLLASEKVTAMFLFNTSAHEPQVTSSLKSLFGNQLVYGKNGLEAVKTS